MISDHAPLSDYNRGYLDGAESVRARVRANAIREAEEKRRAGGIEFVLQEEDRQLLLLALAVLSLESPGFDFALHEIAKRVDNITNGRAQMYDQFRELRRK